MWQKIVWLLLDYDGNKNRKENFAGIFFVSKICNTIRNLEIGCIISPTGILHSNQLKLCLLMAKTICIYYVSNILKVWWSMKCVWYYLDHNFQHPCFYSRRLLRNVKTKCTANILRNQVGKYWLRHKCLWSFDGFYQSM